MDLFRPREFDYTILRHPKTSSVTAATRVSDKQPVVYQCDIIVSKRR